MATIIKSDSGRVEIKVYCGDGKRRTIRFGCLDSADALTAAKHVQELADRQKDGGSLSPRCFGWVSQQSAQVLDRLGRAGLITSRLPAAAGGVAVRTLCDRFLAATVDRKPETRKVYDKVIANLTDFFPESLAIDKISKADASTWRADLAANGNRRDKERTTNLRQHILRLCKRARVSPWPKLFVNFGASCIWDLLADTHDVKLVAKWVGNSPAVIMKHYAMHID